MQHHLSSLHSAGKEALATGEPITCPYCGFDYVHLSAVVVHQGQHRHTLTGRHAIHETNAEPSGRGSTVTVAFWCEEGHAWTVAWAFHKGQTFTATRPRDAIALSLWRD